MMDRERLSGFNKRVFPRAHRPRPITLHTGHGQMKARMVNISEGGMSCVLAARDARKCPNLVRTIFDVEGRRLPIKGSVVRRRAMGTHIELGISFLDVSSEQLVLIRSFVEVVLARAS